MERAISVEERIRRAEEIYEKRRQGETRPITKVNVNNSTNISMYIYIPSNLCNI